MKQKFKTGDFCIVDMGKNSKWSNVMVRITGVLNFTIKNAYECETTDGSVELLFYENELEGVFEHDLRVGLLTRRSNNG